MSDKSRRAKAMQHVYVIWMDQNPVCCRIGCHDNVGSLLATMKRDELFELRLYATIAPRNIDPSKVVDDVHALLLSQCIRNDWFQVTPEDALEAVIRASGHSSQQEKDG